MSTCASTLSEFKREDCNSVGNAFARFLLSADHKQASFNEVPCDNYYSRNQQQVLKRNSDKFRGKHTLQ